MKASDIFKVDERREKGAWINAGFRDLPGLALKVRGDGNADAERKLTELFAAATPEERRSPDFEAELNSKVFLDCVLLDWNLEEPFSRQAAAELLKTATFRMAVAYASRVVGAQGAETLENDLKN